jgi:hypothetical protein
MSGLLCGQGFLDFELQAALGGLQGMFGVGLGRIVQGGAVQHLVRAAIGHHEDAVAGGQQFRQFGGDDDDALARRGPGRGPGG